METRNQREPFSNQFLVGIVIALASLATPVAARSATDEAPPKVAIIVGPVGLELTPTYIELAELAASAAEERGAVVARAYSPDATAENVLDAVEDANVVVYFGHGVGAPNPYSDAPSPTVVNGWGLNGPNPSDEHADAVGDGSLAYYGEAWIAANARPAPGWVMIYSNACYAPGAGEGFDEPADEETALARVGAYSRAPLAELGASAYFATDFYAGAAELVATLLDHPDAPYGEVFAAEPRYRADAVTTHPHPSIEGAEAWLQHSPYFEGLTDYWYAFAGDPDASLATRDTSIRIGGLTWQPGMAVPASGSLVGHAVAYAESPDHPGRATVALAPALAESLPADTSRVRVCADRCALLPVASTLPDQLQPAVVGTAPPPAIALSQEAWLAISDQPLGDGPLLVRIGLRSLPSPELPSIGSASSDPSPQPSLSPPADAGRPPAPPPPPTPPDPSVMPEPSATVTPEPSPQRTPDATPGESPPPATTPQPSPSSASLAPSPTLP